MYRYRRIDSSDASRPDTVATAGRIHCEPNAVNVLPGAADYSIDVRDVDEVAISTASAVVFDSLAGIAARRGIGFESELTGKTAPTPMSASLVARLESLADSVELRWHRTNSGALHDAAMMANVCNTAMIFVPSKDGRSHSPRAWTDYADIAQGAELLLAAVIDQAGT